MTENRLPIRIEAYYANQEDNVVQAYADNGYPSSLDDVETAITVMNRMAEVEQQGAYLTHEKLAKTRTISEHYEVIPAIINTYGHPIRMIKIPINELQNIGYPNQPRMDLIAEIVQTPEDITKLPPPVITFSKDGWSTLDGQTRISRLKQLEAKYAYAYFVDEAEVNSEMDLEAIKAKLHTPKNPKYHKELLAPQSMTQRLHMFLRNILKAMPGIK